MAGSTDHPLERLIFFSDAVIAISITLLVIEIHAPRLEGSATDGDHLRALAGLMPSISGFLVSFFVIGLFWMGHHRAFSMAERYSPHVLGWNLAFLAAIAFMPFATAYLSTNIGDRVPTVLYCVVLLLASLLNLRCNTIATGPAMVRSDVSADQVRHVRLRGLGVVLGAVTALLIAVLVPIAGQLGLISIPIWQMLLLRLRRSDSEVARPT
jgi:uncharacterized membrane protein